VAKRCRGATPLAEARHPAVYALGTALTYDRGKVLSQFNRRRQVTVLDLALGAEQCVCVGALPRPLQD
jgi:hypothetical protein